MISRAIRSFEAVMPEDYLALAMELALTPYVASRCSAVDRAYYAAFLAVRSQLDDKGYLSVGRGPGVHVQVADLLAQIDSGISRMLVQLRLARNLLTYQTGPTSLRRGQSISELLDSARRINDSVKELPQISP